MLALGSPAHPIAPASYDAWATTYEWRTVHDTSYLHAGSLFIHQFSHVWVDFRGIRDAYMRRHGTDYFQTSRRVTEVQQQYATRDPHGYSGYEETGWGITASNGPGNVTREIAGIPRRCFDYLARGVPDATDDGTIAPWAVVASLPFAPEIIVATIEHMQRLRLGGDHPYEFRTTYNPTFPDSHGSGQGWASPHYCGLKQRPIVIMIENYRSGLIWDLLRSSPHIVAGRRAAGFTGRWFADHDSGRRHVRPD